MKRQIFLLTLIFILLLSGCASASNTPRPATIPPDVMPRLDPSPTPSSSTLPLTCQITDLNVYVNEVDGYCFAYPSRFTLGDQPSDKPDVRGPAVDESAEPMHATLSIEVSPAAGRVDYRARDEDACGRVFARKILEADGCGISCLLESR
jgi:hypothetical protein